MKRLLLIGLLTLSCGDDGSPVVVEPLTDSGPAETTFVVTDSGSVEAGATEAGTPDASPVEAGPVEASVGVEAGNPDAGIEASTPEASVDAPDSGEALTTIELPPLVEASVVVADSGGEPDAEPVCTIPDIVGSECNVELNCGCLDETTVCRVANIQTGQTLCFPVGEVADYSLCEADVDCASASVCELGVCRPKCSNVNDFCADGSWCGPMVEGHVAVCQGHCNVLAQATNEYGTDTFWIELMQKQLEREMITQAWTQAYVACGDSVYCHPGLTDSFTPYAHCVPGLYGSEEGSPCVANRDCANGLGCYDNYCRVISFTDTNCPGEPNMVRIEGWMAPDGYNHLGVCVEEE